MAHVEEAVHESGPALFDAKMAQAEAELYGALAALRAEGRLTDESVRDAIEGIAEAMSEGVDDQLWELNEVLVVSYDALLAVGQDLKGEELEDAYLLQVQVAFATHLREHLEKLVADNPALVAQSPPSSHRSRLSPLASTEPLTSAPALATA